MLYQELESVIHHLIRQSIADTLVQAEFRWRANGYQVVILDFEQNIGYVPT
jgi:hypothetical protein